MKIIFLLFIFLGCNKEQKNEFATVEANKGIVEIALSLTGRAEAARQTSMMAPDDLVVDDLLVSTGQNVKEGEVLCKLDPSKVFDSIRMEENKLAQADSQLKATEIRLNGLKRDLNRTINLLRQGAASVEDKERQQQELQILETQLNVQNRDKKSILHSIESLKIQAELLAMKAPFDGVITYLWTPKDSFVKGSSVKKGDVLFRLASEGKMLIKTTLREQDISYFQQGQKLKLTSPALAGLEFPGTVSMVDNAATIDKDSGIGSFRIYIEFTPPKEMKSGMEVIVNHLVEKKENVLTVPKTALNPISAEGYEVMLIEGEQKIKQKIKVGLIGDLNLEVLSGLIPGQKVMAQYEE